MKHYRNKKQWRVIRAIALFLVVNIIFQIAFPSVAWAITSGPTAPEYSSFEPVEATDMVNLQTGDFTYNLPILEVPGSEGGYPLSLSYHAGITPDEEASWVGLGWTLNAGAINRFVNMYPDDYKGSREAVWDSWVGGMTDTWTGAAGWGPVTVGMTFANDTYRGNGVGMNVSIGIPLNEAGTANMGVSAGVGPYGGGNVGVGLSMSTPGSGANASATLGYNLSIDESGETSGAFSLSGGVGYRTSKHTNWSAMDISMATGANGGMSASPIGVSMNGQNGHEGELSYNNNGWYVPIPLPYGFHLGIGHNKSRYYVSQFDWTVMNGSLYPKTKELTGAVPSTRNSLDSYAIKDISSTTFSTDNPESGFGGSMPAYDEYSITAQGLGGAISPYTYEYNELFRRDNDAASYDRSRVTTNNANNRISFRFVNDFSNRFTLNQAMFEQQSDLFSNSGIASVGKAGSTIGNPSEGFDRYNGYLAGSKAIKYYTNSEVSNTNGTPELMRHFPYYGNNFILDYVNGSQRGLNFPDQIGAFSVTNESGVTYHYALPVYNFETTSKTVASNGYTRVTTNDQPYAYAWLLTGITGPDFVDSNGNMEIDDNDWGYWVKFNYGLWTNQYIWRNPTTGSHKDVESGTTTFSYGKKQLYYLNSIRTRTHTALFVKDIRKDAKGVSNGEVDGGYNISTTTFNNQKFVTAMPAASLRLDRIMLFENASLNDAVRKRFNTNVDYTYLTSVSDNLVAPYFLGTYDTKTTSSGLLDFSLGIHKGKAVLDIYDLKASRSNSTDLTTIYDDLKKITLKEVEFVNNNYELCNKTENSFDLNYKMPDLINTPIKTGKLTLKEIAIYGRNGIKLTPNMQFDYAKKPDYNPVAKDMWGNYNKDYDVSMSEPDKKLYASNLSAIAASDVDAWSLTSIKTPLGASINIAYESDNYVGKNLNPYTVIRIKNININAGCTDCLELELYSKAVSEITSNTVLKMKGVAGMYVTNSAGYPVLKKLDHVVTFVGQSASNKIIVRNAELGPYMKPTTIAWYQDRNGAWINAAISPVVAFANLVVERTASNIAYGGGLRVKSISVKSGAQEKVTEYAYGNGVTSYEPYQENLSDSPIDLNTSYPKNIYDNSQVMGNTDDYLRMLKNNTGYSGMRTLVKNEIGNLYKESMGLASFLPSPTVLYDKVTVKDKVKDGTNTFTLNSFIEYGFTTFDWNTMNPRVNTHNFVPNKRVKVTYRDFKNKVGLLKYMAVYSDQSTLLNKTTYQYLHDLDDVNNTRLSNQFSNQGRIDQMFYEQRNPNTPNEQVVITEYEEWPVIPIKTTFENNLNGTKVETTNLAFDFFSGAPNQVLSSDALGNLFVNEQTAAYKNYNSYSRGLMGPYVPGQNGYSTAKNMLIQPYMDVTYKVLPKVGVTNPYLRSDYENKGVVSSSIQDWKESDGVWRKTGAYVWLGDDVTTLNPDGTYPVGSYSTTNYNSASNNNWALTSEVTDYDNYSTALQSRDMYYRYSAQLTNPNSTKIIASASLNKYNEIAYSGAEYMSGNALLEGNVDRVLGVPSNSFSHTGQYSLMVSNAKTGFTKNFTPRDGKKYRASVWVKVLNLDDNASNLNNVRLVCKQNGVELKSVGRVLTKKSREWYHLDMVYQPTGTSLVTVYAENASASNAAYFDDFRMHCIDGPMTSYVYEPITGRITDVLGADNLSIHYEYGPANKWMKTYQEIYAKSNLIPLAASTTNYGNY